MNAKNKRAVIYARVSSENDRQDTSRQITDLQKFSEAQNMEIVKTTEHIFLGDLISVIDDAVEKTENYSERICQEYGIVTG